jgi:hypothetical protein
VLTTTTNHCHIFRFCESHQGRDATHVVAQVPEYIKPYFAQTFEVVCKLFKCSLKSCGTDSAPGDTGFALATIAWMRQIVCLADSLRYYCGAAMLQVCLSDDDTPHLAYPTGNLLHQLGANLPYAVCDKLINLYLEVLLAIA